MNTHRPILVTRWASQSGRRRGALEPGYAVLDGREPQDLLAFAPAFARHVRYFDLDDKPDGDWSAFFLADSATLLATMANFNSQAKRAEFNAVLHRLRHEPHHERKLFLLEQLFRLTLNLMLEVNRWVWAAETMHAGKTEPMLRRHLHGTAGGPFAALLARLRGYAVGAGQPGALGQSIHLDVHGFHPVWRMSHVRPEGAMYRGHFRWQKIEAAIDPLRALFEEAIDIVSDLAERAKLDFQASLDDPHHSPHVALYMAFAKQYCAAAKQIDSVVPALIDFYYRDILHEPVRPPQPDQLFLTFTLAPRPGLTAAAVPAGTQFPAGADAEGRPDNFAADQALTVTAAKLMRARTLRMVRGPLYDGAPPAASQDAAHDSLRLILDAEVALANASDGGWPLFGASAVGTEGAAAAVPARLGFAIASPALLLTGGQRKLTFRLTLNDSSDAALESLLEPVNAATGLDSNAVLAAVISAAFQFKLSTAQGWLDVPACTVDVSNKTSSRRIALQIDLPPAVSPIVPQDASGAAAEPALFPTAPILWAECLQSPVGLKGPSGELNVYPLAVLDGLAISRAILETRVTGLPVAPCGNAIVPAEATPFFPFASPALVGAGFEIAPPELFAKTPTRAVLKLDWVGVPAHPLGFAGYYAQYVVGPDREKLPAPIDNKSFQAELSLVGDPPWGLPPAAKAVYLFRTEPAAAVPEPQGEVVSEPQDNAVPAPQGKIVPTTQIEIAPVPAEAAGTLAGAALRLTLSAPAFGFGEELYQPNILNAAQAMIAATAVEIPGAPKPKGPGLLCRFVAWLKRLLHIKPKPAAGQPAHGPASASLDSPPTFAQIYPNPPWRPQISRLAIDYEATTELPLGARGQFFHLPPTGLPLPAAADANGCVALLPALTAPACLDLGFSGLGAPQPLTLLFQFVAEAGPNGNAAAEPAGVRWFADGAGGWSELSGSAIQSDGTSSFKHAGIVSLRLPSLATDADGLAWLRLLPREATPDAADRFPSVVSITPHALTATRVVDGKSRPDVAVPPKTVKAPSPALVSLATTDQPLASFGGRAGEAPATLPVRVGERMRHKERASLAWDYERLVLEHFPEIAKVSVLPARDEQGRSSPGHVLVVVMSEDSPVDASDPLLPKTSAELRGRIADRLAQIASPFACIHVVNPVYVRARVQASVLFRGDAEADAPIRLDEDLRGFLSPRSDDFISFEDATSRDVSAAVANFIATRSYVAGLIEHKLDFAPDPQNMPWCVLTSAPRHDIVDLGRGFAEDQRSMRTRISPQV